MASWKQAMAKVRQTRERCSYFLSLFKGCSAIDLGWLANWDALTRMVRKYDHRDKAVYPVTAVDDLPWPAVWCIARYNRKHRWQGGSLPRATGVASALAEFRDRMSWRWFFRDTEKKERLLRMKKKTQTCQYRGKLPPELEGWLEAVRQACWSGFRDAVRVSRSNRVTWWKTSCL